MNSVTNSFFLWWNCFDEFLCNDFCSISFWLFSQLWHSVLTLLQLSRKLASLYIVPLKLLCTHRQKCIYTCWGMCTYTLVYTHTVCLIYCGSVYIDTQRQCNVALWIYMYINSVDMAVYTHVHGWVLNGNLLHLAKCCPYWNIVTAMAVVCNDLKYIIRNYLRTFKSLIWRHPHIIYLSSFSFFVMYFWLKGRLFKMPSLPWETKFTYGTLCVFPLFAMEMYREPACSLQS